MEFGVDEVEQTDTTEVEQDLEGVVAIVAVPSSALDANERRELQEAMQEAMKSVKGVQTIGPAKVLAGLEDRDPDTCPKETLCLSSVGREAGVSRILIGRVSKTDTGYRLDIDYFDVKDKLFVKYKSTDGLGSFGSVIKAVEPSIKEIFGVRDITRGPNIVGDEDTSVVQTVFAVTSLVLSVACIGGGIYYGLDAADQEKQITDNPGGFTQRQAQTRLAEASNTATTANIFYALGLAFGVTSVLLFTIDFGSDVDESEEVFLRPKNLQLTPSVGADSVGFGASFSF
jgi:hypothetical protein